MRMKTDMANALLDDTVAAAVANRPDTMLRVLECKAAAGEAATEVLDLAMRVCAAELLIETMSPSSVIFAMAAPPVS